MKRTSLLELLQELPQLVSTLVRAEFDRLKREIIRKAKRAGIGIGFFAGAVAILLLVLPVLIVAAILGIAVALPAWAAALIVAGGMLIVAAVLAFLGIRAFRRMAEPLETPGSVERDIDAVRGVGDYDF
ncbi:phage holin family protein [Gryllotalpicola sp.]|uniref:phage holin family protein n=1 Tax=Gryllotalpicola sp. TaxID=1932787 RepID=UPI00262FEB83|nr:phage holin family protein [Gryllotalpicola sp.]